MEKQARDRELAPETSSGDEALFAALVARAGARLLALGVALTGDLAAAEDLVQEALARVWRRRRSLAPGALDGYVLATVRNLGANRRERLAVETRALARQEPPPATAAPGDGPDLGAVLDALARLPDEQREVVLLRVYDGLAFKDVAARTKAPLGTVHSRYRLALERLRSLLGAAEERP